MLALALMVSLAACGGGTPTTIDGKLDLYEQKVGEMGKAIKAGDMNKLQSLSSEVEKLGKELEAEKDKFTDAQKERLEKVSMDFAGDAFGAMGKIFSGMSEALGGESGTTELEAFGKSLGDAFKEAFGSSSDGGPQLNSDLGLSDDLGGLLTE